LKSYFTPIKLIEEVGEYVCPGPKVGEGTGLNDFVPVPISLTYH